MAPGRRVGSELARGERLEAGDVLGGRVDEAWTDARLPLRCVDASHSRASVVGCLRSRSARGARRTRRGATSLRGAGPRRGRARGSRPARACRARPRDAARPLALSCPESERTAARRSRRPGRVVPPDVVERHGAERVRHVERVEGRAPHERVDDDLAGALDGPIEALVARAAACAAIDAAARRTLRSSGATPWRRLRIEIQRRHAPLRRRLGEPSVDRLERDATWRGSVRPSLLDLDELVHDVELDVLRVELPEPARHVVLEDAGPARSQLLEEERQLLLARSPAKPEGAHARRERDRARARPRSRARRRRRAVRRRPARSTGRRARRPRAPGSRPRARSGPPRRSSARRSRARTRRS